MRVEGEAEAGERRGWGGGGGGVGVRFPGLSGHLCARQQSSWWLVAWFGDAIDVSEGVGGGGYIAVREASESRRLIVLRSVFFRVCMKKRFHKSGRHVCMACRIRSVFTMMYDINSFKYIYSTYHFPLFLCFERCPIFDIFFFFCCRLWWLFFSLSSVWWRHHAHLSSRRVVSCRVAWYQRPGSTSCRWSRDYDCR